jgi:UDP-glucose 4-epimerase
MNKILITGHRGWIGSNFTQLLDQHKIEWIGIDRVDGEDLQKDIQPFLRKIRYCDTVVHLAATPRIPPSWKMADDYRNNNIGVTDQIARLCAEQGKHLIYSSSSSVYGNGSGPLNPYSWTKLAGEESIEMYGRSKGLNYTNLRLFTNYGEDDPSGLVIGKWLKQKKLNENIVVRGTGEQSRDFIHVTDTARALLACCQQKPNKITLDIGTGISHKLIDVARAFKGNIVFEPELEGYATDTMADCAETHLYLPWKAQINLIDWIQSQI